MPTLDLLSAYFANLQKGGCFPNSLVEFVYCNQDDYSFYTDADTTALLRLDGKYASKDGNDASPDTSNRMYYDVTNVTITKVSTSTSITKGNYTEHALYNTTNINNCIDYLGDYGNEITVIQLLDSLYNCFMKSGDHMKDTYESIRDELTSNFNTTNRLSYNGCFQMSICKGDFQRITGNSSLTNSDSGIANDQSVNLFTLISDHLEPKFYITSEAVRDLLKDSSILPIDYSVISYS